MGEVRILETQISMKLDPKEFMKLRNEVTQAKKDRNSFHESFVLMAKENKEMKQYLDQEQKRLRSCQKALDKAKMQVKLQKAKLKHQEKADASDVFRCEICCDRTKSVVFVPCGHTCCKICSSKIMKMRTKKCHICRAKISKTHEVYF